MMKEIILLCFLFLFSSATDSGNVEDSRFMDFRLPTLHLSSEGDSGAYGMSFDIYFER